MKRNVICPAEICEYCKYLRYMRVNADEYDFDCVVGERLTQEEYNVYMRKEEKA